MPRSRSSIAFPTISVLATFVVMLAAASGASAKGISVTITSPRANTTVTGSSLRVQARVHPARQRHTIGFYVDGKLVSVQHRGAVAGASRSVKIDAGRFTRGRHLIRVVVKAGKKHASSSVTVNGGGSSSGSKASQDSSSAGADPQAVPGSELFPTGNVKDFQLIFADNFTKDAALGSFASDCDANKIVYTGASGTKWRAYPNCYTDTYQKRPYRSDQVLSVQNGNLDFYLHSVDGQPAGANPSPVLPNGSQYQTYGRYSARVKVDSPDLSEYYVAWLLWPSDESSWASAESDFPEGSLSPGKTGVSAYHHFAPGQQEWGGDSSVDMHQWHTYTQEWAPGVRRYYVDGRLIKTTLQPVFSGPERWQLQTETNGYGSHSGHLLVDWVAVYSWAPGTPAG